MSNGDAAWQNKNNFYYGGQPRYETSRSHAVPLMQGRFALRLREPTNTLPNPDECFYPQRATRCR